MNWSTLFYLVMFSSLIVLSGDFMKHKEMELTECALWRDDSCFLRVGDYVSYELNSELYVIASDGFWIIRDLGVEE